MVSPESLQTLQQEFPDHHFYFSRSERIYKEAANDVFIRSLIENLPQTPADPDTASRLRSCLANLPSDSSIEDVASLIRIRLAVHTAKAAGCDVILWSDTSTRLAERILGETAQGRGFSLPWQVNDIQSPHGVTFLYPLRDLTRSEVALFAEVSGGSTTKLVEAAPRPREPSALSHRATIWNLMSRYFETVEQNYPNIVSNVVRITTKLTPLSDDSIGSICELCGSPTSRDPAKVHDWQGYQHNPSGFGAERNLCYGCTRTRCG